MHNKRKHQMKIRTLVIASLASFAISSATANADVVAVDFGADETTVVNYNISNFASSDVANLVRLSDGTSTGISLTVIGATQDNAGGIAGNGGNTSDTSIFVDGIASVSGAGFLPDGTQNTAGGQGGPNNNVLTFTFGGLDDAFTYDLVGGTSRAPAGNLGNFETDWTTSSLGGNGGSTLTSDATAATGYVSFAGLTSTNGLLSIIVTDASTLTAVSQLALTINPATVPEPSSVALIGLGGLALMLRRRK